MNTSKNYLALSLALLLGLAPVAVYGAAGISGPPTDQNRAATPPVEQPLVPEGVFAIQLMEALKVGTAQDEAQAENQLSALGIEPHNGWIAGYPMTPPAMGEIEKSVALAAEGGKLKMGKDEALKVVGDLKTKLGLNINPAAEAQAAPRGNTIIYKYVDKNGVIHFTDQYESIPKEYRDRVEMIRETAHLTSSDEPAGQEMQPPVESSIPSPGPEVVNDYYYDYGPPVVTYYAPPAPYSYLYSWVPYPFWWGPGFFFSGYFMLHDFHRHVGFYGRNFVCSNHVFSNNRGFMVNPVTRGLQDSRMASRVSSPQVFNSSRVQSSARTIVGQSQNRQALTGVQSQPRMAMSTSTSAMNRFQAAPRPSTQQRVTNGPVSVPRNNFGSAGRTFSPPASSGRFFSSSPPRVASAPTATVMHGPVYSAPAHSSGGSFGGGHSSGGFSGRGGGSSGGGGGSRGGGHR